ncbi:MAG: hypothetical protein AAF804_09805 [Bacteroidota bacterium]
MKLSIIIAVLASIVALTACEQGPFEDPNLNFEDTYPAFVRFDDEDPVVTSITDSTGNSVTIPLELPAQVYPDTEVSYDVSGAFTASGTATIEAGLVDGDIELEIPQTAAITQGDTLGFATITLTSATNNVALGRGDNALGEEIDPIEREIQINKN